METPACLLCATRLLRKWDRLVFLLKWPLVHPGDAFAFEAELNLWLQMANRTYTPPSPSQASAIQELLARLRREKHSNQLDLVAFHC